MPVMRNRASRLEKARQRHPSVTRTPTATPKAEDNNNNNNNNNNTMDFGGEEEEEQATTTVNESMDTPKHEHVITNVMTPTSTSTDAEDDEHDDDENENGKQNHERDDSNNMDGSGGNHIPQTNSIPAAAERAEDRMGGLSIDTTTTTTTSPSNNHGDTTGHPTDDHPSPLDAAAASNTPKPASIIPTTKPTHQHNHHTTTTTKPNDSSSSASLPSTPFPKVTWPPSTKLLRTNDLPCEPNARGMSSPWAWLWFGISTVVPVAYVYIGLVVLREWTLVWPELQHLLQEYLPHVAAFLQQFDTHSSRWVEGWCVLEAVFFLWLKWHMRRLDRIDPLEASLSSAPLMDYDKRATLWQRMLQAEHTDAVSWIRGWFFDQAPLENIQRADIRAFVTWCMFEGRNVEHLTVEEAHQLEDFIQQLEHCISLQWYGEDTKQPEVVENDEDDDIDDEQQPSLLSEGDENTSSTLERRLENDLDKAADDNEQSTTTIRKRLDPNKTTKNGALMVGGQTERRPVPNKLFRFPEHTNDSPPDFFSNLYESYRRSYEKYRTMIAVKTPGNFHPVEDFWNFWATTQQNIVAVEENAMAAATQTAENAMATATETAANMYERIVPPGSNMDKQLHAIGQATHTQLEQAFHSLHSLQKGMTERLETAKFLSTQRRALRKQIKGYQEMLQRLRDMSSAVPSRQMALLMRRITESTEALDRLEGRAKDAFVKATGYARKNLLFPAIEPQRYAKYSSDPLLGVATYPLGFHLLILGATEIPLRVLMRRRGFEKRSIGPISYYFHPGAVDEYEDEDDEDEDRNNTPIVFVHGIGIGLISYLTLIDHLLKLGRPIFLPEIPYVSSFRPWQGPYAVLPPASVCSTLTAMLATHGFLRGAFVGHSYGTSWLSYMVQYAPTAVAAVLFLDPICFCLHVPRLTKKFVYHRPDPGKIEYIVRTDLIVNWTIQRSFPWSWISLFVDQIHVPCSVFLSGNDALVPAQKVEDYFLSKGEPVIDFKPGMDNRHFFQGNKVNACIFRGHGHGDWTDYPTHTVPVIVEAVQVLCSRAEDSTTVK